MLDRSTRLFLVDVAAVAQDLGGGRVLERPRHHLEILALFDRCRGLFRAVRSLADDGLAHEALVLTRPLFTESLMLLELAAVDETRRIELVAGWRLASLASFEGVLLEAQARGDDVSDELAAVARQRTGLEAYARRNNASTRHWRVDEKSLADKHRGGDGYLDFRMAHHFVHGTSFASDQRYTPRGGVTLVGGPAAHRGWERAAALSAAQSMLFAVRGVCGAIGWSEPPELRGLLEQVERLGVGDDRASAGIVSDAPDSAPGPQTSAEPMSASEPRSETSNARAVALKWGDLEALPLLFANHLLSQSQPQEGMLYLTFGQASPPPFIGTPDQVRQQANAVESLEIKPLVRLAVTPEKLREFIRVLRGNLEKYEQGLARLEAMQREEDDAG